MSENRGGSRIFSRGGGCSDFLKMSKVLSTFYFPSSPKALKRPCFVQIFWVAGNFLNKQTIKGVFRHFLENLDQKIAFSARAPPSKLVYIGTFDPKRTINIFCVFYFALYSFYKFPMFRTS